MLDVAFPGEEFDYDVRVMQAQAYGAKEIFAKKLLFLLPFYIMRYEDEVEAIAKDEAATNALLSEISSLRSQLEELAVEEDSVQLYENLVELTIRVSDYVLANHDDLMKEVRRSMGGEVLVLMNDRIAAERQAGHQEGLIEGKREGYAEGKRQGLEQGLEQGRNSLADALLQLGIDSGLLDEALKQSAADSK